MVSSPNRFVIDQKKRIARPVRLEGDIQSTPFARIKHFIAFFAQDFA